MAGLLLLYPAMASLYPLLPPMLGLMYIKWREALQRRDYIVVAVWMLYAIIFETVWNLPLYGLWTVMAATYAIFDPRISHLIHSDWLIGLLGAVIFDLFYLAFLIAYGALMHTQPVEIDLVLLYYLVADIAGVLLF
jgi:hypothetical protein